jgi:plastocyanin
MEVVMNFKIVGLIALTILLMSSGSVIAATPIANVSISNFSFQPQNINVSAGTIVIWTNLDPIMHTVTSDTGLFDSGPLSTGQTFSRTFNTPGNYDYHCNIHSFMTGKILVSESGGGGGGGKGFVDDVALLQSNGWWAIKYDFANATNGSADKWIPFGDGNAQPVVGDFSHTGTPSDVALLQSNGWWAIKYDFANATNGSADKWIPFGDGTAKPVVGDFDHDGFKDDVALLQSNGWWAIKYNFNRATNGTADKWIAFGDGTAKPVIGNFNNN